MSIGFIHEPMVVGSTQMQERIENMAQIKRDAYRCVEWANYAIPCEPYSELGAQQVLAEVNSLTERYTREGYQPIVVLPIGGGITDLVLEGSGRLSVLRVVILWGLPSFVDEDKVAARIRDMEDAGVKRIE